MTDGVRSIILRLAAVFAVLSAVCLFITEKGTPSFWAAVFSLIISAVVIVLWIVTANKNKK